MITMKCIAIKHAQHLLLTTTNKIADIATSCGFTSFSQFNRVFQKINQQ
ncbi:MAG: helix-turn-helix domain-containing protein [Lachnotalea sp.]